MHAKSEIRMEIQKTSETKVYHCLSLTRRKDNSLSSLNGQASPVVPGGVLGTGDTWCCTKGRMKYPTVLVEADKHQQ